MTTNTKLVRTVCPAHCGIDACGITAHVLGGRVVKVEPADFPNPKHRRICLRGLSSLDITYHPDRLKYPMKRIGERGEGKYPCQRLGIRRCRPALWQPGNFRHSVSLWFAVRPTLVRIAGSRHDRRLGGKPR